MHQILVAVDFVLLVSPDSLSSCHHRLDGFSIILARLGAFSPWSAVCVTIQGAGCCIGAGCLLVVIGEMSGNQNQSFDPDLENLDAAAKTYAQDIKLQTYTANIMAWIYAAVPFEINNRTSLWFGKTCMIFSILPIYPWNGASQSRSVQASSV